MGPHAILRVRGGQPIGGGPALEDDEHAVQETVSLPTNRIKERIIHAGQPRFPVGPNLVLSPLDNYDYDHSVTPDEPASEMPKEEPPREEPQLPRPFSFAQELTPLPQEPVDHSNWDPETFQMCAVGVTKTYTMGKVAVPVLKGVNLGIREGEFLSIVGQSGSGKSTLLHLLGTLDIPDGGTIHFDGQRIDNISSGQRDILRNRFIGMIFQFYHLLPELSVLENVLSPLMIRDTAWKYLRNRSRHHEKGKELLEAVGLSHRLKHKPNELSGGEIQRTAIARALISEPQILLADEPTGNLDAKSAREILELLRTLNRERNLTIVMVTHDLAIAKETDRMVSIYDGKIN